jgi:hypothetical protein
VQNFSVDVCVCDVKKRTPLFLACERNWIPLVQAIGKKRGQKNRYAETAGQDTGLHVYGIGFYALQRLSVLSGFVPSSSYCAILVSSLLSFLSCFFFFFFFMCSFSFLFFSFVPRSGPLCYTTRM